MTGKTVVTRQSEWDDYARARALALLAWEARKCPNCGNYDCLVPLPKDLRLVTWDEHGSRKFEVVAYRCLACASSALVTRDWNTDHEKDKPIKGAYSPGDGRMFIARPAEED